MRLVLISDTHNYILDGVPDGDVLVHAGDFTSRGTEKQIRAFAKWMKSLPHKHKVVIAGNHDLMFENDARWAQKLIEDSCTYLQDGSVLIDGVKFYGTPYQPWFHDWAFNIREEDIRERIFAMIPNDTDVLITHSPPYGVLDECADGRLVGCRALLRRVTQVEPKLHVFGHIHESYGQLQGGKTRFVNASSCTLSYTPDNAPIVMDLS